MFNAFALVAGVTRRYLRAMVGSRGRNDNVSASLMMGFPQAPFDIAEPSPPRPRAARLRRGFKDHGERLTHNMQGIRQDVAAGRLDDVTDLSDKDLMARLLRR